MIGELFARDDLKKNLNPVWCVLRGLDGLRSAIRGPRNSATGRQPA
jgi:hypothetical protein